jgi:hypothetical protein
MRFWAVVLLAACVWGQSLSDEANAVLARAREHVLHTTTRLPKYVCQETINRTYLSPTHAIFPRAGVCPAILGKDNPKMRTLATDRLRLDVAVSEGGELDSWPAASNFDSRSISDIVTSGPISTGAFGINLMQVFENAGAKFELTGVESEDGSRVFLYHYTVPVETSHYMVWTLDGIQRKTAYSGDFDVVEQTGELERLKIETGLLPVEAGMCRAQTTNFYHRVTVGDGEFLIPLRSILRTIRLDGTATESVTTFSSCHEYGAESTIRFDQDDDTGAAGPAGAATHSGQPLPWGAEVVLKLDSSLDTDTMAAGDIVWARIAAPVRKPKSKAVALPAGVRVRGRVIQALHSIAANQGFDIVLEFDRYELDRATVPFDAVLKPGRVRLAGTEVSFHPAEGGGKLSIRTKASRIVLPRGLESKWMTISPPKTRS